VRANGTPRIEQVVHDELKIFIQDYRAMNVPRHEQNTLLPK
jgi:hypothetical protein